MIPDNIFQSNKFELVFDEKIDEIELKNLFKKSEKYEDQIEEHDFESECSDINQDEEDDFF